MSFGISHKLRIFQNQPYKLPLGILCRSDLVLFVMLHSNNSSASLHRLCMGVFGVHGCVWCACVCIVCVCGGGGGGRGL